MVRQGCDARAIYTGDGSPEDRYVILQEARSWKVYYAERDQQLELRQFPTENEACEYLLGLLRRDQTVWGRKSV